ncbi:phosphatase PAP2 family protein [Paenibacillus sp. N3/727]|uniref:phosphatase PAP2 family protein n=1 Tax=Paenibacillus sp. N3/727 TaxID=2925845 RepID=UPI001F537632|nr:phosphatase PAP2 family protein [Paenibacillus sp. N3/727]UNK19871.1 phosphatase PAP2 family protein [Paenibacillus sp. N3/727]
MLYQSMTTITLFTTLNVIVLLWIGTLQNPFKALFTLVRELFTTPRFFILFAAMAAILMLNKYELQFEQEHFISPNDFTPMIFQLEGFFVKHVQEIFYSPWLTPVLAYFYLLVFQALIIGSIGVYLIQHNKAHVYAICYAILINYTMAIPFFLFFPVNETWSYQPAGVTFYMLEVFPNFESVYRPLSGLDNCFPSLHTSLSVTMAVLAFRSGNRRWAIITGISAAIIIFSIFYLGIHWLSDMIAGTLLGLMASSVGIYLGRLTDKKATHSLYYNKMTG